ncbi:transposase [Cryobacterium sp. PAMC25264]|uniref:transposase n=1 Tax=Cryobacterium sp. PAMC25264 TaxID=2861288 RepID=UPI001C62CBD6|nr:transposase [Cryobacterium sp. PAMC25264]QYF72861.1 transposase [Cryobacterium sp. PAMC25264]
MTYSTKDLVLGIDTHKDFHHAAVINHVGKKITDRKFDATPAGYRELIGWATDVGRIGRAGVEGTGSYGAGLTRTHSRGIPVIDVIAPDKQLRRLRGKTDTIDAYNAARAVLNEVATASRRFRTASLKRYGGAHVQAVTGQAAHGEHEPAPGPDRERARGAATGTGSREGKEVGHAVLKLPRRAADDLVMTETTNVLRCLGKRYLELLVEADSLMKRLGDRERTRPGTAPVHGVGPDVAATMLIVAGENVDRLESASAFAHLIGTAPIPASSGKTNRHRLNRGGNRQGNSAAYRIVMVRMKTHEQTRDYVAKSLARGKTKREAMRMLKRYVAREIFQILISIRHRHELEKHTPIAA